MAWWRSRPMRPPHRRRPKTAAGLTDGAAGPGHRGPSDEGRPGGFRSCVASSPAGALSGRRAGGRAQAHAVSGRTLGLTASGPVACPVRWCY
eukprot:12215966-Alexandrium_andersonii.AAC.1